MSLSPERTGRSSPFGFGLQSLTLHQLDTIHFATLKLLREVGLIVESREAAEIFGDHGCRIKTESKHWRVYFSPYLVEEALLSAPSSVTYHARDPRHDHVAEPGRVGFTIGFGESVKIYDLETGELRATRKQDCEETARISDYYDPCVVMERNVCPAECLPEAQPLHNIEAIWRNCGKHIFLAALSGRNVRKMAEMGAVVSGGAEEYRRRPLISICLCPTSPLTLVQSCCDIILETTRQGMGFMAVPMPLAGATSPVTMGGTIVQHNAEVLSTLVLQQLAKKGSPFTYASSATIMDLKTGQASGGAIEFGMFSAAMASLATYYRLPSWVSGGLADAKLPDAQAGYEAATNLLLSALSGANIIYGSGVLEGGLIYDYAKAVMDMECAANIRRALQGISTDNESLALDLIAEVGPGGNYLTHRHTFKRTRSQTQGVIFDRHPYDHWLKHDGGRQATERAYDQARRIVANHRPALELSTKTIQDLNAILTDYESLLRQG